MVVIIDAGVRSGGETVAGMFKETRRAYTIGDTPTAGTSSSKTVITVPSGLLSVRFAIASNMGRYNKGRGIEGIRISPHQTVPYLPEDLTAGRDTQITIAENLRLTGFPSGRWITCRRPPPPARKGQSRSERRIRRSRKFPGRHGSAIRHGPEAGGPDS